MYAGQAQIIKSFQKFSFEGGHMNTFLGFVLLLIYGKKLNDKYFSVDMAKFQKHLDDVLYLTNDKPERDNEKKWFILFHDQWVDEIKRILLAGNKLSANDFAIVLFWTKDFSSNESPSKHLQNEIKNDVFF
jgi:hypothetical protein